MKRIKLDAEARIIIFRVLFATAVAFAVALIQSSFLPFVGIFGVVPDIVLAFVVTTAFFNGLEFGIAVGLISGIICDMLGGVGVSVLPLVYVLVGGVVGYFVSHRFARNFIVWLMGMVGACAVKMCYSAFICIMFSGDFRLIDFVFKTAFPEFTGTLILSLALYFPLCFVAKKLRKKGDKG